MCVELFVKSVSNIFGFYKYVRSYAPNSNMGIFMRDWILIMFGMCWQRVINFKYQIAGTLFRD
jgi:hypothetical protein